MARVARSRAAERADDHLPRRDPSACARYTQGMGWRRLSTGAICLVVLISACGRRGRGEPLPDGALPPTDGSVPTTDGGGRDGSLPPRDGGGTCIDETYTETLPNTTASIDDLVGAYTPSALQSFVDGVLTRRYPIGAHIVAGGRASDGFGGDCVEIFSAGSTGTASDLIDAMGTVVHECGHFYDLGLGGFGDHTYVFRDDLTLHASMGDATDRGGRTFARSLLNEDDQAARRPPCGGGFGSGCDSYADTYLDGDPFDSTFDGGDQGFDSVMEEAVQYVNSLATAYAFADRLPPGLMTSARDGILTFMWWTERYLRLARLEHTDAYTFISGDPAWRTVILTMWGRASTYLELTSGMPGLGIDDAAIRALVDAPELRAEIDAIRALQCP